MNIAFAYVVIGRSYWVENLCKRFQILVTYEYSHKCLMLKYIYTEFCLWEDKVCTGYDLMPGTPEMYCSELVYYAWQSAGISLYTHTVGFIMPSAIYNSAKTYPVEVWGSGY